MAICCISSGVCLAGEMRHFKMPRECSSFEAKYPRNVNFVECSVAKDIDQKFVTTDEIIATLCEVRSVTVLDPMQHPMPHPLLAHSVAR